MSTLLNGDEIIALHDQNLLSFLQFPVEKLNETILSEHLNIKLVFPILKIGNHLEESLLENHFFNCLLWRQEDLARDSKASDVTIANVKRLIDKLNQQRNNRIEKFNQFFLERFPLNPKKNSILVSETPGSICDRLSIISLKIFHMNQAWENAQSNGFKHECEIKLEKLIEQRQDLVESISIATLGFLDGSMYFKTYFQFKMYNDKRFNKLID